MTLSPATRAAQALHHINAETGGVSPAIELSSTFARDADYAPRQPYIYGRDGGPTTAQAEAVLASLDGAARALAFSSGMGAITTLMETLPNGAHIAAPAMMYHGTLSWLRHLEARGRIRLTLFDPTAPDYPAADLLWLETPINPTWEILDIAAARAAAPEALLAVDCTAAPPTAAIALERGADIAFHSATKYLGGHSDLTAGILSLREDRLASDLMRLRTLMGSVLAPFEAWLLIRGLRTLFLRWERASANALAIARHFDGHPRIAQVLYPGLESHPGHAIAAAQMPTGFGGMLSLLTDTEDTAARTVRRTRLWIPATSLGGVESLIEHRKPIEPPESTVPPNLLRLSTGIEAAEDLITDLEQALT